MHHVLKPGGHLLFVEHGLSPDASVRKCQNRLDPLWSRISGGCHLNCPIQSLIGSRLLLLYVGHPHITR